jgi:DNA polymerase-3 subunit beta
MDGGLLAAAISQVGPAASRDDTLPMLTGVCLDIDGDTLTLAATDRYRLAVRAAPWHPVRPGLRAAALVPARTLADAARARTPGTPVEIAFETGPEAGPSRPRGGDAEPRPAEGMISFTIGGRQLTTRLIGGEFIRYRSRFPAEFGGRAEVPGALFTDAVRRVSLVADRASPVRLRFSPGSVLIEAQTEGRARAVETVRADFAGSEPVIAFNPHYLLDGLTAALVPTPADPAAPAATDTAGAGDDDGGGAAAPAEPADPGLVSIEFTSPAKPALITRVPAPGGDDGTPGQPPDFRYLVVPLRAMARP